MNFWKWPNFFWLASFPNHGHDPKTPTSLPQARRALPSGTRFWRWLPFGKLTSVPKKMGHKFRQIIRTWRILETLCSDIPYAHRCSSSFATDFCLEPSKGSHANPKQPQPQEIHLLILLCNKIFPGLRQVGVSFARNLCHLSAIFAGCILSHVICIMPCTYIPHAQIHMYIYIYIYIFIYISVCI